MVIGRVKAAQTNAGLLRLIGARDLLPIRFSADKAPPYAFISHCWLHPDEEPTLRDLVDNVAYRKAGFTKLQRAADVALRRGLEYFWIDTCCVDGRIIHEVRQAIKTVALWLTKADICFVYLSDVKAVEQRSSLNSNHESLRKSKWFTRSWTLVELLVPQRVEFFSDNWTALGDKSTLEKVITEVTLIPARALQGTIPLKNFPVELIRSWTDHRESHRPEDEAYCLLSLLEIDMTIHYDEGKDLAWGRLNNEIEKGDFYTLKRSPTALLKYETLNEGCFRLLIFDDPSQSDDATKMTARFEERGFAPGMVSYIALSYTWGQEAATHEVFINGRPCLVRPNLFYALRRMRRPGSQLRIWVDSLCIDQLNLKERSAQVLQMSKIFSNAESVHIWLGQGDSASDSAMRVIPKIADGTYPFKGVWTQDPDLISLENLMHRPWFRRAWVVQEYAVSRKSKVFCGDEEVEMKAFDDAIRKVRKALDIVRKPDNNRHITTEFQGPLKGFRNSPATRLLNAIEQVFSWSVTGAQRERTKTLEQLVYLCNFSDMSDKRDAVYSLLSLSTDWDEANGGNTENAIEPNYAQPEIDTFANFMQVSSNKSLSLDMIVRPWAPPLDMTDGVSYSPFPSLSDPQSPFPSWICCRDTLPFGCPSLSERHRLHSTPLVSTGGESSRYNACDGKPPKVTFERMGEFLVMKARGVKLGEVKKRSPRMADAIISKQALDILACKDAYSHHPLPDNLWRCLIADRGLSTKRAPAEYRDAFTLAWRRSWCRQDPQRTSSETWLDVPDRWSDAPDEIDVTKLLEDISLPPQTLEYLRIVRNTVWNRRVFKAALDDGSVRIGLIPKQAEVGDQICILWGCSVPVVLRANDDDKYGQSWTLIGEAFVHGLMNGEAFTDEKKAWKSADMEFAVR